MSKLLLVICSIFLGASSGASLKELENFPLAAGFEFVGSADGKIFVTPILSSGDPYYVDLPIAIETCVNASYNLASITSQAQSNVIKNFHAANGRTHYWLDGTDFINDGDWFSPRTGKRFEYTDWISGHPLASTASYPADCLIWHSNLFGTGWWSSTCGDSNRVMCDTSVLIM